MNIAIMVQNYKNNRNLLYTKLYIFAVFLCLLRKENEIFTPLPDFFDNFAQSKMYEIYEITFRELY